MRGESIRGWLAGLLIEELPAFAIALLIAEGFFKFGSFSAEAVAFVLLWRGLQWLQQRLMG